ncbi:IS4 family transposase [Ruminococcus sp. YE71]|uniref:IS4 family transposase n=4 Tax=unclassified Ruminococcus TaxID=2608920 RepID=UPI00241DBBF0|nr:IS4 family transposase [Ruminococcus sp. YE71]
MESSCADFVNAPGHDFTRKSTLSFSCTMRFLLSMGGGSLNRELAEYFDFSADTVSVSALVQRRSKIRPEAFSHLLKSFNNCFPSEKLFCGRRLLSVDGSDIDIPHDPSDNDSFIKWRDDKKGYNLLHLNALYDLTDKRYYSAVVQPFRKKNEHSALIEMIDSLDLPQGSIIVADRNYESYNNIETLRNKSLCYVIRVKKSGVTKNFVLPESEEFDIDSEILLSRKQKKEFMDNKAKYRYLPKNVNFPFLPPGSSELYPMSFRVVRFRISEDTYETLITNLPRDEFGIMQLKEIYRMRWGIETSFRELKYSIGLNAFHAKKRDFIEQEMYARMIMYNFSMLITEHIEVPKQKGKHMTQLNITAAIHVCMSYLKSDKIDPAELEKLIARRTLPVRPDRHYKRKNRGRSAVSLNYRIM